MKILAAVLIFLTTTSTSFADYRFERKEGNPTLLIFVHGIVGNGTDTWSNVEADSYWPKLVSDDPLFDRADVLVYDYPSSLVSQNITINELAKRMEIELRNVDVNIQGYEEVLFVAHSMGGLVTRQYLLSNPDVAAHVNGLFLFATPMKGSFFADALRLTSRGSLATQMSRSFDASTFLSDMRDRWRESGLGRTIRSFCAAETEPVYRVSKVVEAESAELLCNSGFVRVDKDHFSIVKPASERSFSHNVLRDWFAQIFPDARQLLLQEEEQANVLLANCSVGKLGEIVENTIVEEIETLGYQIRSSDFLPRDWRSSYRNTLWRNNVPRIIVIHLGCFHEEGTSDEAYAERTKDFRSFLNTIIADDVRVFVYSRAFRDVSGEEFFRRYMPPQIFEEFITGNRLSAFPVRSIQQFGSENVRKQIKDAFASLATD